jgi:glucose/arabinose dehydrogenase
MASTFSLPRIGAFLALGLLPPGLHAQSADTPARHVLPSLNGNLVAERVLDGISQPTAIEFLPDGRALVSQRDRGLLTLADFSTGSKTDIEGLPKLVVWSDAGVHDLELHPDYARNGWIYVSYTEGEQVHSTAVLDRFRLKGNGAVDVSAFSLRTLLRGTYHFSAHPVRRWLPVLPSATASIRPRRRTATTPAQCCA